MSLWRDEGRQSRLAIAVVALLALLAIGSLARVFSSLLYLAWAVPAVAVGATFALTYGRRSLALAFGVMAAVTTISLPSLFAKDQTNHLFPTRAAWRLVWTLFGSGLSGMMNENSPVPAHPRYLIVLWAASLAGGFLGASWIVVGRPIGAVISAAGVLAYAGSVGVGHGRDLYAIAAVVLVALFLLFDGRHRIATWSRPPRRMARRAGVTTLLVAAAIGLVTPAVLRASTPLVDLQSALRPRIVIIKPLSDVRRQLDVNPPVEVMRVRASQEAYWRLTALDTYTGREWLLEAKPDAVQGGRVPQSEPMTQGSRLAQHYAITSLLAPWLPAAYAAESVDSPFAFDADERSSTLLLHDETVPGLRYSAVSRLPAPPSASLSGMPQEKPDASAAQWADSARPWLRGAKTAYEQAIAIQNTFRKTFRYNEKVPGGHDAARLQRFLAERTGYCEQFAATMTLMLRGLGIQARVGVGFLPGVQRRGEYVVSTRDAHAWVEGLIPGMGWVQFDPTPGRGSPPGAPPQEEPAQPEPTPPPLPAQLEATPTPAPDQASQESPAGAGIPWARALVLAMLASAIVGVIPGAKALRRRLRHTGDPAQVLLGAWAELVDGVADLGSRTRATQTQWEVWRRAFARGTGAGAEPAARVVGAATRALYGGGDVTTQDAERAWADCRTALGQARRAAPWLYRLRALFDPRTLVPRITLPRLLGAES